MNIRRFRALPAAGATYAKIADSTCSARCAARLRRRADEGLAARALSSAPASTLIAQQVHVRPGRTSGLSGSTHARDSSSERLPRRLEPHGCGVAETHPNRRFSRCNYPRLL